MERVRAFVALNLPVAVIDKVARVQAKLREAVAETSMVVAWVPPPNMHVTIRFLGEIPFENTYAIRDRLGDRLEGRAPVALDVAGVGVFPGPEQPRVLWVGLHDETQELARLGADINSWLDDLGFTPDTRPFRPHLTLGRIKQGAVDVWSEWADHRIDRCTAGEIVLYRSVLERRGAQYDALSRFSLQRGRGGSASPA